MKRLTLCALLAACGNDSTGSTTPDAGIDPDPLAVESTAPPGSLDHLHETIIERRCSGQPGLCHNGQFEPNLSTPALTYAYLVNRPSLEKIDKLRVKPGDPANSVFIDKIRNRGVATQMPLGAEPLSEEETQAIEQWIRDGALRAPGAAPAPVLNNPPRRPQVGVFSAGGTRLDGNGPVTVAPGTTIVLRHSVQDFETPDSAIPFAGVNLFVVGANRAVVLAPGTDDPQTGQTTYDASGPMGIGDRLNYQRAWTVPATLPVIDPATKVESTIPASGASLVLQAFYIDELEINGTQVRFGIFAFDAGTFQINIQ